LVFAIRNANIGEASITPAGVMQINATVLRNRLLSRAKLRHLQVFVKTAELGSVKGAAEAVGLSQPSATQVLADLELLLECRLFLRHSRGMTLTSIGDGLLPLARRFVGLVDESATQVAALAGHAGSVVRIAAITAGVAGLLAEAIPAFIRAHPAIRVHLQEVDAARQAALVTNGDVDCAISRTPAVIPEGWEFIPLLRDRFAVIAGPHHPLAQKPVLTLEDLLGATWLSMPVSVPARGVLDALFAESSTQPTLFNAITASPGMIWALLSQEPLLALIPLSVVKQLLDAGLLVELPIAQKISFDEIGLLMPRESRGEAVDTLCTFMKRFAGPDIGQRVHEKQSARPRATQGRRRAKSG
jgi:DNA-binding transcriptional LysR family regulator